ncbi:MAG TPA: class I SAM-dependent methyltransferase, partial [Ilumatobacteraceae bacterium]|nr:class I SAM-dependent methyltransferase [Ilumatobacteraceae bacterium]
LGVREESRPGASIRDCRSDLAADRYLSAEKICDASVVTAPSQFYTGLVAELYASLRSADPDVETCARFVTRKGTPALELGCGDGDPLLELRRRALDVEGLDSSADMLDRCRQRAAALNLDVTLHHAEIENMDLGRRFRSIFLAGATFNLIVDDATAGRALERIAAHLEPGGAALIPLFVPPPVPAADIGRVSERIVEGGHTLRCTTIAVQRRETERLQTATLRYERVENDGERSTIDRDWTLHWYTPPLFAELVAAAGLRPLRVVDADGAPARAESTAFAFIVAPA